MSDILLTALKIGYLALLWIFVLLAANVIRTDLFGRKVPAADLPRVSEADRVGGPAWLNAGRPAAPATPPPAPTPSTPSRIVVTNGPHLGMAAEVDQSGTYVMIGRSPECAIVLDDDYVSTRHARVVNGEAGLYLEDLGSTNGTFVNGRRISSATIIGPADEIRIGRTILKLEP
ncbi:FHA domain-containing protein FhaB/FipA [Raineyella fluvialis]|uniref:FHA domain-containing protein n=1 Tax=Raineyella fluvialis TaxID=2662261 RepID=A0A5Q2FFR0_9ACTN|nr:FHA domain-containing protein [Raineyella fluvialis]QGF23515.1 FHA domain-containing protein [Raineyella fluvialis]